MTCIVGLVDKEVNKVYMGSDSCGSNGYNITLRKDTKIFKNKEFIIGCTSSYRMIQILRFSFIPPHIPEDKDIYEYMCTDFIDSMREVFKTKGFLTVNSGVDEGGTMLVAYKDRLFKIESDFQVGETLDGIYACGGGESYALGSLYTTSIADSPIERLKKALDVSSRLSVGVLPPFIFLNT